jgi:hypothetical protein
MRGLKAAAIACDHAAAPGHKENDLMPTRRSFLIALAIAAAAGPAFGADQSAQDFLAGI